jgi:hypothetical protein
VPFPGRASFHIAANSALGSTAIMWSASGANNVHDWAPDTATAIGTRCVGRSHSFAESTW